MTRTPLPPSLRAEVEETLRGAEEDVGIADVRPVGGGCINPSARVETTGGEAFFLKWNEEHPDLFTPEADGLDALTASAGSGPLRVPEVVGVGDGGAGGPGWLLLEFVEEGPAGPSYGSDLGRGLAGLHRSVDGAWGWSRDNFIGSLPQTNDRRERWSDFWVEARLHPQLERARRAGHRPGSDDDWRTLFRRMPELVGPAVEEGPSLLHGDLWGGNVYPGPDGAPVLIDPAVYRGHREVDLAMTDLFGGFPAGFLPAYDDRWPLEPGYRETRRPLYQLYPLLVHVNLFGSGYVARTRAALSAVLRGG